MNNKIGRNDSCPCGSGKKYKNCCLNRKVNDTWTNYKGEIINYDKEKNQRFYNQINELARTKLFINQFQARALTISEGTDILQECYEILDNALEDFYRYSACKEGCNHCCYEIVETSPLEAEYIRKYVNETFNEKQKYILQKKIERVLLETPTYKDLLINQNIKYEFYKKKIPCIFLDDKGECMIYRLRPLNCRKLLSFSESFKCENSTSIRMEYTGEVANNSERLVRQASVNCYGNKFYIDRGTEHILVYKPLPYWLRDGFSDTDLQK